MPSARETEFAREVFGLGDEEHDSISPPGQWEASEVIGESRDRLREAAMAKTEAENGAAIGALEDGSRLSLQSREHWIPVLTRGSARGYVEPD